MHKINIYNGQKAVSIRVNRTQLKNVLGYILRRERGPAGVFNFIFVDNKEINRINRQYLGRKGITDVIAFPLSDNSDDVNGEVIVSVEEALRQSRKRGIPLNNEIALYCIHGLLHLMGYDDLNKTKRLEMEQKQSAYLDMWKLK